MAGIFHRAFVALGRLKYALHWPLPLCSECIFLWQELSERRMIEYGWGLEPSAGCSPSKHYWNKVKKVAGARRACRAMDPSDLINVARSSWPPLRMVRMEIRCRAIFLAVGFPRAKFAPSSRVGRPLRPRCRLSALARPPLRSPILCPGPPRHLCVVGAPAPTRF